jgi:tetratricopeptide (TPR) repeat protein
LPELAEAVGGWRLNEKTLAVPVEHQWEALEKIRARLSGNANDPFARWGAWILDESGKRNVSPFSTISAPSPSPAASPTIIPSAPPSVSTTPPKESNEHMLMTACIQHGAFSFASLQEPAFALESYRRALDLAKKDAAAKPDNFDAQKDLFLVHTLMCESFAAVKQPDKALSSALDAVRAMEQAATKKPGDAEARKLLAQGWGNLAYTQIMNRQPQEAINSASKGLEQDPSQTLIKANLAIAFIFNNEYAKAEPILVSIKDVKANDKQTYVDLVLKSFDELKQFGVDHPDTQKARELLRPSTPR